MKQISWNVTISRYASGSYCMVGPVIVAKTSYSIGAKSDPPDTPRWKGTLLLPSIKQPESLFLTEEAAKAHLEMMVKIWFKSTVGE